VNLNHLAQFRLVKHNQPTDFESVVAALLRDGWTLVGAPFVHPAFGFCQAMQK
jgi:hypothetical protein